MESDNMTDIVAAAKAHLASLPAHLKDRYSANIIAKLVTELTVQSAASPREDIVPRLRKWTISTNATPASDLMDEAANEIERLRNGAACPHVRGTVTQHCSLNFTLTDEEREAIRWFSQLSYGEGGRVPTYAATLRKLLERFGNDSPQLETDGEGSRG
jgi:hypothetical protein